MRKVFAGILALTLLLSCCFPVFAQEEIQTEGLYSFTVTDGAATITKCDPSISGDVVLPATLGGYPVKAIGDGVFSFYMGLTSVAIPEGITVIGNSAFAGCYGLRNVLIPASVESIGTYAFAFCTNLPAVGIPNGVQVISNAAFSGCEKLSTVKIPESVTVIGKEAFFNCTALTSIQVAESNTTYSSDASGVLFNKDKTKLIQAPGQIDNGYQIPESVQIINASAFTNCLNLTAMTIPDSVQTIGAYAFYYCENMKEVTIGTGVRTIGAYAFSKCKALEEVTVSVGLETIEQRAFSDCQQLAEVYFNGTRGQWTQITIGDGNTGLDNARFFFSGANEPGDVNSDGFVNEDDAIYLLQNILMPDLFPLESAPDFDKNGVVDEDDAIYLLQHVLMPDVFPL